MIVSLGELDSSVRKAFRGAGYHWGEAEEAGKAASWLAMRGFEVGKPIATLLAATQGTPDHMRPAASPAGSYDHQICPVLMGIALADGAISLETARCMTFAALHSPLLLLPFLSAVSRSTGYEISLVTESLEVNICNTAVSIHRHSLDADGPSAGTLTALVPKGEFPPSGEARACSVELTDESWNLLNLFAGKTYVPASEHSRNLGAGAGVTDQD